MRKFFLLSLCLMCVCCICACSSTSSNENKTTSYDYTIEEAVDDVLQSPDETYSAEQCGASGTGCNETPLINYTKTEADYRAYGERMKQDHLYTQASTGNNLTATIRPEIEEDIVVSSQKKTQDPVLDDGIFDKTTAQEKKQTPSLDDGIFDKTTAQEKKQTPSLDDGIFEQTSAQKIEEPDILAEPEVKLADNIVEIENPKDKKDFTYEVVCSNPDCTEVQKVKRSVGEDGTVYEIICDEECDDVMNDDTFSSEFTEESFDIADYVKDDDDSKDIVFKEIGKTITAEVDVKELRIDDNAILTWEANEGDNLRELLSKWSAMSGWKLLWNTNRNYVLNAGVMFKGKFVDVSSALIRAFARARPAPIATFYKGNRVIVVETMENENAY